MVAATVLREHRLTNRLHSLLLVGGMVLLLGALGASVWGVTGLVWLLAAGALMALLSPTITPQLVMRAYRARPLDTRSAPGPVALVAELARRAGLPRPPRLYWIPSRICNAFAVGSPSSSAIGLTDCLLRRLEPRELAGVLAHEIAHIRHGDLRVMGLADLIGRLTRTMSWMGQLLLVLNLPLIVLDQETVPWLLVVFLIVSPTLAALLQLALSRTREFDADAGAVELTGDPRGLASALAKLERIQGSWWQRILLPERGNPEPSVLRTHPHTEQRVRRLLELEGRPLAGFPPVSSRTLRPPVERPPVRIVDPRVRASGVWY